MKLLALIVLTLLAFVASVMSFVPGGGVAIRAGRSNFNPPAPAAFPSSGLIHYWTLNEAAGNPRADSVGSTDLNETGGTCANDTGLNGNALVVNPPLIRYLTSEQFTLTKPFSFAGWIRFTQQPTMGNQYVISHIRSQPSDVSHHGLEITSAGVTMFGGEEGTWITGSGQLAINTWHLIVGTWDTSTMQVSINGAAYISGDPPVGWQEDDVLGEMGDAATSEATFLLDAFGYWNRALSAAESAALYNGGAGLFP